MDFLDQANRDLSLDGRSAIGDHAILKSGMRPLWAQGQLAPIMVPARRAADYLNARRERMSVQNKTKSVPSIDIGIAPAERENIAKGLSALLADSYTLYLMTHNFHWNVTGPMFNTLHLMFMEQYTEQWNALDLIAERIRALGHPAPGTYKEFVKRASIKEVEGQPKANEMIRYLVSAQEATARTARQLFPVVNEANDQPTADLLTQRLEVHEKTAWMLRSLLEE
jgi:starvation-inducible DNA-binding protein